MASLLLIMPCFGYTDAVKIATDWLDSKETRNNLNNLGITQVYNAICNTGTTIGTGLAIVNMIPKGKIVRFELEERKNKELDYIVCIDGDGQIPFKHVFDIIFQLKSHPVDAVFACRKENSAISDDRTAIEKFELFLIGQLYGTCLPDGQCGCWGLRGNLRNIIDLKAEGFEIELDLLTELLRAKTDLHHNITLGFIEVNLRESEITTFKLKNHRDKIVFVCNKLQIGSNLVAALADRFEILNEKKLPNEYKDMLSSLTLQEVPMKYPLCLTGSCINCLHRDNAIEHT